MPGKSPPIGQHVDFRAGQNVSGLLQQGNEAAPLEEWFSPGEAEVAGCGIEQWQARGNLVQHPAVVLILWRLRAHQTQMVAAFCHQKRIVLRLPTVQRSKAPSPGLYSQHVT